MGRLWGIWEYAKFESEWVKNNALSPYEIECDVMCELTCGLSFVLGIVWLKYF